MKLYSEAAMERAMRVQEVILRAIGKRITWWQAAEILGISCRSMRRWKRRYEVWGYDGLYDRRRGQPSPRRVPLATVEQVLELYREKYFDCNVRHFHEKLREEHGLRLSYTWVMLALQGAGLVAKRRQRYSAPPGYRRQRPAKRPKLDAWVGVIDQILEADQVRGRKQRHTAKRIYERLRDEHGYGGGYTIVKDYVRLRKVSQREMFVPLVHPPGDAQADFGEALVVIGGVEQKAHYLVIDLPQSDDCFVMGFPAERTEAFLPTTATTVPLPGAS